MFYKPCMNSQFCIAEEAADIAREAANRWLGKSSALTCNALY